MKHLFTYIIFTLAVFRLPATTVENQPATIGFPNAEVLSENTVRIPFDLADHLILLKATINGQYGNLILDTGAKNLVLNKVHFRTSKPHVDVTTGYGVNGVLENIPAHRVLDFAFDTFRLPGHLADIVDLSHIETEKKQKIIGIIGKEVICEFEVYIDFFLRQVTLFKLNPDGDRIDNHFFLDTPADSIPFSLEGHSIVLHTRINNTPLRMVLDTASEINFLDSGIPEKALENFRIIKRIHFKGIANKKTEAFAGKLYGLRLEKDLPVGIMRTILANLDGMSKAFGTSIDGVLGYEFIGMRRFLINYKKKAVIFVKLPYTGKTP
ncbi:pepsin/retropepsin-like aspartic protease family protein [Robertkochia flava]|uniref:aspartyl protease family protein n=1 Tax=Robertkochia flava TaxID=3447986 RepID=UPI001CCE1A80|nr:aspartyl protease family protein [Robertkochia marina]